MRGVSLVWFLLFAYRTFETIIITLHLRGTLILSNAVIFRYIFTITILEVWSFISEGRVKTRKRNILCTIDAKRDHEPFQDQMLEKGLVLLSIVLLRNLIVIKVARLKVRKVTILLDVGVSKKTVEGLQALAEAWLFLLLSSISDNKLTQHGNKSWVIIGLAN